MSQSKLFIHIGTWKTGSSTIQHNLYSERKKLRKEGFYYLSKKNEITVPGWKIGNFERVEEEFVEKTRVKLSNIIEKKNAKKENVAFISSDEHFSGDPFRGFKNTGIVAKNIFEITKDLGLDVYIIVYLRRQDDFFESLYQQSVRLGDSHSFTEFLTQFDSSHFNWLNLIEAYADLFGKEKMIVRRYHQKYLPKENSLVQDFGKMIGSESLASFQVTTSRNRGFSRDTLEIMRVINRHFEGDEQFELRKIFDQVDSKLPFKNYSFFSDSDRVNFLNRYNDSNRQLAKEYLGEEVLFPAPNYKLETNQYSGISVDTLIVNFSKALLLVKKEADVKKQMTTKKLKRNFLRFRVHQFISRKLDAFPAFKKKLNRIIKEKS